MSDFRHVIAQAYREILQREPDPGGLEGWNQAMNAGITEAAMRESFLRSVEYKERFPGEAAPPPPPPPPAPGGPMALTVVGNKFVRQADGREVKLLGIGGVCCTETAPDGSNPAVVAGWPLISDAQLRLLHENLGNFGHIRLGPFTQTVPGDEFNGYALTSDARYDLDSWNPVFWSRARHLVELARSLGIYIEVDVLDGWLLRNGAHMNPWNPEFNIQGESHMGCEILKAGPPPRLRQWVEKVVEELGEFDNVLWHLGNENFVCKPVPEYEAGLAEVIRETEAARGFPRHLIGSNTEEDSTPYDYIERHITEALYPLPQPVMVNEYDDEHPTLTPEAFSVEAAAAWRWGTSFHLWMGQMTPDEWLRALRLMKQIVDGTRPAIPAKCPPLVRWKAGVFSAMDSGAQLIDKNHPVRDGFVRLDSTPFFRGPEGPGKCNTEGDVCSGRRCEDPRGGRWTQISGPVSHWRVSNPGPDTGYSVNIGGIARRGTQPLLPGHYVFEVRPLPDAHDGEIPPVPLEVAGEVRGRVEFTVT